MQVSDPYGPDALHPARIIWTVGRSSYQTLVATYRHRGQSAYRHTFCRHGLSKGSSSGASNRLYLWLLQKGPSTPSRFSAYVATLSLALDPPGTEDAGSSGPFGPALCL